MSNKPKSFHFVGTEHQQVQVREYSDGVGVGLEIAGECRELLFPKPGIGLLINMLVEVYGRMPGVPGDYPWAKLHCPGCGCNKQVGRQPSLINEFTKEFIPQGPELIHCKACGHVFGERKDVFPWEVAGADEVPGG